MTRRRDVGVVVSILGYITSCLGGKVPASTLAYESQVRPGLRLRASRASAVPGCGVCVCRQGRWSRDVRLAVKKHTQSGGNVKWVSGIVSAVTLVCYRWRMR